MNNKAAFETITFGAWLIYWFEMFKKPIIKPNSARFRFRAFYLYQFFRAVYVVPFKGDCFVSPRSRVHIKQYQPLITAFFKAVYQFPLFFVC